MINFFIKRSKLVNLLLIFILLTGLINLFKTNKKGYPSVDFGLIHITTLYHGASPKEIETKITSKIEKNIKGISGIKRLQSSSLQNMSLISIQLEDNIDLDKAKTEITQAINQTKNLPKNSDTPIITEIKNDTLPVLEIAIGGNGSYEEKRLFAKQLEKKIINFSEVSSVEKLGYLEKEIHINLDPKKMKQKYVSIGHILQALSATNFQNGAGDIKFENNSIDLKVYSLLDSLDKIRNTPIRTSFDGSGVFLKDISIIENGFSDPTYKVFHNHEEIVHLLISQKANSDVFALTKKIKALLEKTSFTENPSIHANIVIDYSTEVASLLSLVINNATIGLILVLFILFTALNARIAFWTSLGIPTSILFAFIFFPIFDLSINFITLMAFIIVLGMLVDDAIIVAENIWQYREKGFNAVESALKGTKEVAYPILTTIATTSIAFFPLLNMKGIFGKFMFTLPIVVILTLLGSLLESLFILPSHMVNTSYNPSKKKTRSFFKFFANKYEKFIYMTVKNCHKVVLLSILIAGGTLFICSKTLSFQLFDSKDGYFGYIKFSLPDGSTLEESSQASKKIMTILSKLPKNELSGYTVTVGEEQPLIMSYGFNLTIPSVGNATLRFTPPEKRSRSSKVIMASIREELEQYSIFKEVTADLVPEGPPVGRAVTITLLSDNDNDRVIALSKLKHYLASQVGVKNISDNEGGLQETLLLEIDNNKTSQYGISPLEISRCITTAYIGEIITDLSKNGEVIYYRVRINKDSRNSLDTISQLTIQNKQGRLIPIRQFIKEKSVQKPRIIQHYDTTRSVTVFADIDTNLTLSSTVNSNATLFLTNLIQSSSLDLDFKLGGEEEDTKESMKSFYDTTFLACIGIYFILVILFNSFFQPLIVMIAIPFSFIGSMLAFLLHGMPLSFPALIGFIGLMGVVVNNSIVMISLLNTYIHKHILTENIFSLIAKASRNRLRPILLTTTTTSIGLFPTIYGFGGSNPVIIPMIMTIAWGLVFSTIVTLCLTPSLFYIHFYWSKKWRTRYGRATNTTT